MTVSRRCKVSWRGLSISNCTRKIERNAAFQLFTSCPCVSVLLGDFMRGKISYSCVKYTGYFCVIVVHIDNVRLHVRALCVHIETQLAPVGRRVHIILGVGYCNRALKRRRRRPLCTALHFLSYFDFLLL